MLGVAVAVTLAFAACGDDGVDLAFTLLGENDALPPGVAAASVASELLMSRI